MLSKITNSRSKSNTKSNISKDARRKKNQFQMWQLRRQEISRQWICRQIYFKQKTSHLKKKQVLVRFKPRAFAAPGIHLTFRLSWPETLWSLNSLWTKIQTIPLILLHEVHPKKIIIEFDNSASVIKKFQKKQSFKMISLKINNLISIFLSLAYAFSLSNVASFI